MQHKMMLLSVLVSIVLVHDSLCRNVPNGMDNQMDNSLSPMSGNSRMYNSVDSYNTLDTSYLKINNTQPMVSQKYGSRVELYCEAWGSPPPTIQWFKRNQKLTENEPDEYLKSQFRSISEGNGFAKVSARLVIDYLLPRHHDLYRCMATNGFRELDSVTKISVITPSGSGEMNFTQLVQSKILGAPHKPRITYWSQSYMDLMGTDVLLPCRSVGNPKPQLKWYGPTNRRIQNEDDRVQVLPDGELRIRQITWDDMGVYTCTVQNHVGEDLAETFLYPLLPEGQK